MFNYKYTYIIELVFIYNNFNMNSYTILRPKLGHLINSQLFALSN